MKHRAGIKKVKRSVLGQLLWEFNHALFCSILPFQMRDRLRCPKCEKVGTWKPHEPPRRWLCKWCGWYEDIARTGWCRPCLRKRVWMLCPLSPGKLPHEKMSRIDPWRG